MSAKNKVLYISLFFTQAVPAFFLAHFLYSTYIASAVVISLVAVSLVLSWKYAFTHKKAMNILKYVIVLLGLFIGGASIVSGGIGSGVLVIAVTMMMGINFVLIDRRMLAYVLAFSFILFLYVSSRQFNEYSIVSVVGYTFSFFSVIVADYYNTRVALQSHYASTTSHSFIGTTIILICIVASFTVALYYLMPRPKAINYGLVPFGGVKQYKGIEGESRKESPDHKENISELPEYTIEGDRNIIGRDKPVQKNSTDTLAFFNKASMKRSTENPLTFKKEQKELKTQNNKAYYSNIDMYNTSSSSNKDSSKILFKVKGKEARFLRGQSYDYFDGKTWQKQLKYMYTIDTHNNLYYDGYYKPEPYDDFTIKVTGKLAGKPIIYMPIGVLRLQFPTNLFYEDTARTVYAPSQIEAETFYTTSIQSKGYYGYDMIPKPKKYGVWYKKQYLNTPIELDKRISTLAKKLTKDEFVPLEKAEAVIRHFQRNYSYLTAQVKHSLHNQKLEEVLFDSHIGNALQFNTALVMLLRSSGVYSRIALGYAPNEYNDETHSFVVERGSRAVWSEVFVPDIGWVALHAADDIPFVGEESVESEKTFAEQIQEMAAITFILIVFSLVLYYYLRPYVWTLLAKRKIIQYTKNEDVDFVIAVYEEVEKYYRNFKKGRKFSCTVQEYEAYVKAIKPDHSYLIELLSMYYNQATYQGRLDFDFDKQRYLESSLYLVHHPFRIDPIYKYLQVKLRSLV